jgi:hypothetical protein
MRKSYPIGIATACWFMSWQVAAAVSPTADELAKSRAWAAARFEAGAESFFSFTYDGQPSAELLKTWVVKRTSRPLDDRRTEHTLVYREPKTGLVLRCVGVEYRDFPTVEWTLYFQAMWDPYFATGMGRLDGYGARTAFAPMLVLGYDLRREDVDFARINKFVGEWREMAPD